MMHLPGFGPKRARRLYDELGHRLARGAARRGRAPGAARPARVRPEGRGEAARAARRRLRRQAGAALPALARAADRRADRRRAARRARAPTASRSPARCAAAPTPSRTSTSSPRRPTCPRWSRRSPSCPLVESVQSSGDAGARVDPARRPEGRPQGRRARPVRQRAAALHRLQGPQRGAARVGGQARAARLGVRRSSTTRPARRRAARPRRSVYERLGLPWIPPELREGRGELEAAAAGALPELIELGRPARRPALAHGAVRRPPGRRGDGRGRPRPRLRVPRDHRPLRDRTASATTCSPTRCAPRSSGSARSTPSSTASTLLIGTETNILTDGSLDYDDDLLAELDWVVASVHTSFAMSEADMTARMIAAMEHPLRRPDRPPDRAQDRDAAALPDRHGARDRGGGAHAHDARDQRRARPARPQRDPRARGRRGGRADPRQLRRALGPQPRADALRHRHGAARLADARAGREHAPVGRARAAAQAGRAAA